MCGLLKRSQRRGAILVIVSVKRDRIQTNTNTYHEHEFERPLERRLYARGSVL